jgi:hypothetical protein
MDERAPIYLDDLWTRSHGGPFVEKALRPRFSDGLKKLQSAVQDDSRARRMSSITPIEYLALAWRDALTYHGRISNKSVPDRSFRTPGEEKKGGGKKVGRS